MTDPAYIRLEKEYAEFTDSHYAVSCNSGTAALHLALLALGIGPGDEVIVPDFTMAACAFAVSYTGARPVFADVDLQSYGLSCADVTKRVTEKTKAIMVVHVYGRLCRDMDRIIELGNMLHVPVIEDACEAQGAVKASKAAVTCYSFFKNKIISAEEGGMLTTPDPFIADKARYLKNMAFSPAHDYMHHEIGYNYRMPDSQAELALKSLHDYPENASKRRVIESWYDAALIKRNKTPLPPRDAIWFYETPTKFRDRLLKEIPSARHAFKPLSSFPMYGGGLGLPNARQLSESLVLLRANPELTRKEVEYNASFT